VWTSAPESEDNPWKYKFTWNPRNVVLAGQGNFPLHRKGRVEFVPTTNYSNVWRQIILMGWQFWWLPKSDSLSYRTKYMELKIIPTMLRGNLRRDGTAKGGGCLHTIWGWRMIHSTWTAKGTAYGNLEVRFYPWSELSLKKTWNVITDMEFSIFEKSPVVLFWKLKTDCLSAGSPSNAYKPS